jgi:hypothetical protein
MVTSHKMIENEMSNRGSKSVLYNSAVKEQRVDGSWSSYNLNNSLLRCTLIIDILRHLSQNLPNQFIKNKNKGYSKINNRKQINIIRSYSYIIISLKAGMNTGRKFD